MLPTKFRSFGQAVSEKIFRNQPIRNKNCLWQSCLLMNRDEMSSIYRGPAIDASYQVSVHLAKWFQRGKIFKNRSIRNKNCLCRPCLLMGNLQRGPSIDASYQFSLHLAERFQRRRLKCEKLTDHRRQMPSDGKSSRCLWQGELKIHCLLRYGYFVFHIPVLSLMLLAQRRIKQTQTESQNQKSKINVVL